MGKKSAVNQAAVNTGRQMSAASPKKTVNKSRTKTPSKKPMEKKAVGNRSIGKKTTKTSQAGNKPAANKQTQTRQAGMEPNENKQIDTRQTAKKPTSPKTANKKRTVKRRLFGTRKSAAKPSSSANLTAQLAAARQKNVKPVDKRSRKAADRAVRNKQAAVKRHRYHGGNYILYYILAGMIVITVLVILANTVLFKCKNITVTGNARYSAEEIISSSGIETGMNLLHISKANSAAKIESALAYIDSVEVKKSFPTGIEISVVEAQRWFGVQQGSITAAVSHGGKIVEHGRFDDLPLVLGMDAESVEVGERLKSTIEGKNDIPALILSAIESASLENVDEVDISDRFSIKMRLDGGRIILELGTSADMESKLKVAKRIINEIGATENVTIIINNPTMGTVSNNTSANDPAAPDIPDDPLNSSDPNGQGGSDDPQTSAD